MLDEVVNERVIPCGVLRTSSKSKLFSSRFKDLLTVEVGTPRDSAAARSVPASEIATKVWMSLKSLVLRMCKLAAARSMILRE
jgi:hypothetical protein